jgi:glutaryl-CoA dehydrogenase
MIIIVKHHNVGKMLEIAGMTSDMHGDKDIADENKVMRHTLNLETVNTHEGTHEIHALTVGRAVLGIPAF